MRESGRGSEGREGPGTAGGAASLPEEPSRERGSHQRLGTAGDADSRLRSLSQRSSTVSRTVRSTDSRPPC